MTSPDIEKTTEMVRLKDFKKFESPPFASIKVMVCNLGNASLCRDHIHDVVFSMLSIPSDLWVDGLERAWEDYLPKWFVASTEKFSIEEMYLKPDQWHFESWVAAICDRGWEWWSSGVEDDTICIQLIITYEIVSVEAFLYIVKAACEFNKEFDFTVTYAEE
jgi:hypothetical protein